ncbi:MAG TPA: DUF1385 domain-containing protein [Candidatus Limnocylindrales bacterium]|nr:DUF1385 domain-containing protein [Candidatus Limnocylindrales bacterium]
MSANPAPLAADGSPRSGTRSFAYGGQALMEGVLMRGRDAIAVALRHPDGRIVTTTERLNSRVHTSPAGKWPFVRGLVVLYETLVIGTRWLVRSANVQAEEDDVELGKGTIAITLLITFGVAIAVFSLLPLFISSVATSKATQGWLQPAIEGLIQVALFLAYLTFVSRTPDIYRVFQYHGAEHMTIHALEAGDPLTVDAVRKYPTAHHRCGTEFLVILVLLSIFVFSLIGRQPPLVMILSRLIGIPILAAVGYEVLKIGAKFRQYRVMRAIMFPGILVQKITTKRPTDDMIEVAISSMEEALTADGNPIPAGSTLFDRDPLKLPSGETAPATEPVAAATTDEPPAVP